jgi:anti-sigma regulatory factor (Ser/Thr protein kinase)
VPNRLAEALSLAALPSAVRLARALVVTTLNKWDLADIASDAELVASELATNAVKATGIVDASLPASAHAHLAMIRVGVVHRHTHVTVEVWDSDPKPPVLVEAGIEDEGGRGLMAVDNLCTRWDHYPLDGGKVVWAELSIPRQPLSFPLHA